MKKQFETPVVNVRRFCAESIITTSGGVKSNVDNMKIKMENEGYSVTTQNINTFNFTF